MAKKKSVRKRLASTRAALIEAAIGGHYMCANIQEANAKIEQLRKHFVCSREQQDEFSLTLWVRGYDVSNAESEKGFYGHYVTIRPEAREDGRYTLRAVKLDMPLNRHPDKRRPPRAHPDWGHPVLRSLREGKLYDTVEAAQKALDRLQQDYPNIAIPGSRKLNIIIYEKQEDSSSPISKYQLQILPEGGQHRINANRQGTSLIPKKESAKSSNAESDGHFTAMIKRRKKRT